MEVGLVVSHLGQTFLVEDASRHPRVCPARRVLGPVAVGDRVHLEPIGEDQGRIEALIPRRNLLTRPAHGGKIRPVAANLDLVVVILAAEPLPDWLLLDQYAAAAAHREMDVLIVVNKSDLLLTPVDDRLSPLEVYTAMGYRHLNVCARTGQGISDFAALLTGKTSFLCGQSGVGKSSLTHAILPDKAIRTQTLSAKAGRGRHTTTSAMLFHLPEGGALIDSPGVSVFGLAEMTAQSLAAGYLDFRPHLAHCRFGDCRHRQDLGCAVREGVEAGGINLDRYHRYLKLVDKMNLS